MLLQAIGVCQAPNLKEIRRNLIPIQESFIRVRYHTGRTHEQRTPQSIAGGDRGTPPDVGGAGRERSQRDSRRRPAETCKAAQEADVEAGRFRSRLLRKPPLEGGEQQGLSLPADAA